MQPLSHQYHTAAPLEIAARGPPRAARRAGAHKIWRIAPRANWKGTGAAAAARRRTPARRGYPVQAYRRRVLTALTTQSLDTGEVRRTDMIFTTDRNMHQPGSNERLIKERRPYLPRGRRPARALAASSCASAARARCGSPARKRAGASPPPPPRAGHRWPAAAGPTAHRSG